MMDDGHPLKGPIGINMEFSKRYASYKLLLSFLALWFFWVTIIALHILHDKLLLVYWFHIICEIKLNKAACVVIVIFGCDNTSDNNTNMHAELGVLA